MRFRDWFTGLAALAALAVAVLAVGGVLRSTQAIVAFLAAIGIAGTIVSRRGLGRLSPLVVLLGVAAALTAIQLIPLPATLVETLSPTLAALRSDGSEIAGVSTASTLTFDVGATTSALVFFMALLAIAVVALRLSASERGRYRITVAVTLLCAVTAAITWIHKLFGLRELYGLYKPAYASPYMLGPLLNSNSLGCLMAMGTMLAIGLAAHRRQPNWVRAAWLLVVIACGSVTVSSISRGATLSLLAGALVTLGILLAQRFASSEGSRKRRARVLAGALPMAILATCLVTLVIWSNATIVERQLSQLSFEELHQSRSKFVAWHSGLELIEESPWFGVGRGAFEASFTRVHEASGLATYSYLENEYLQAVVDWGVPGALLLGAVLCWLAWVAARRWRDGALVAGALGGLTVIAMQSNVDFGLEFLGLAAPVVVVAATLTYVPLRELHRPVVARAFRAAHVAALVVGAALLFSSFTTPLDEDRKALSTRVSLARVRESIHRHPLDYYGYAVAAELLQKQGDPQAIRLLNHAMALHPTHPQLHRLAARMLLATGFKSQSSVEYGVALRTSADPRPVIAEILEKFTPEQAAAALPIDHPQPEVIVRSLQDRKHADVARMWLTRVLDLRSRHARACDLLFANAQAGDIDSIPIATKRCSDRLPDYQTRALLARQLVAKQELAEAVRLLSDVETWQSRREEKVDAWLVLCDAQLALGYADEAKRCLRRLDASPDMLDERRAEILKRIDDINHASAPAVAPAPAATGSAAAP